MIESVRIRRLPHAVDLPLPDRSSPEAAGYDLRAAEPVGLWLSDTAAVPTGVCVEIPKGYVGLIRGRSGLAFRQNVWAFDGTIDADYRGEIKVLLANMGAGAVSIKAGDRIAQLVIVPCLTVPIVEVDTLEETERGEGGFGSTGR